MKKIIFSTKSADELVGMFWTDHNPVICVTAEKLANANIESVKNETGVYRNLPETGTMIIKDFQFLSGKPNMQKGLAEFLESSSEKRFAVIIQSDWKFENLEICDEIKNLLDPNSKATMKTLSDMLK